MNDFENKDNNLVDDTSITVQSSNDTLGSQKQILKTKDIVNYSLGVAGINMTTGYSGSFRNAFLYAVFFAGLNADPDISTKMAAQILATVAAISIPFEFVIPTLIQVLLDRTRTKWGKFRPYGLFGIIPFALVSILLFIAPELSYVGKIAFLVIVSQLWNLSCCILGAAQNITAVMSPNSKDRNNLMSVISIVASIMGASSMLFMYILGFLNEKFFHMTDRYLYLSLAIFFAGIAVVTVLNAFIQAKERIIYKSEKPKIGKNIFIPLKYKPFIIHQLSSNIRVLCDFNGLILPLIAALATGSASNLVIFGLPSAIGSLLGLVVCSFLIRKIEPRNVMIFTGIYVIFISIIVYAVGIKNTYIFAVLYFFFGLHYGCTSMMPGIIRIDVLDYIELKTGQRLEGLSEVVTGNLGKLLKSAFNFIAPFTLVWIGFKTPAQNQSMHDANLENLDNTIKGLLLLLILVPGLITGFSLLLYIFYDLVGEKKKNMQMELEVLREKLKTENSLNEIG